MFKIPPKAVAILFLAGPALSMSGLPVEFSPDGKLLAAVRPGKDSGVQLVLFSTSMQSPSRILCTAESISGISFSPLGTEICFAGRDARNARETRTSADHGGDDLYIVALDGSVPLRITYQGGRSPAFSPSGKAVAYLTKEGDLAAIGADGRNWRIIMRRPPVKELDGWMDDGISFQTMIRAGGFIVRSAFTPPARHYAVRISPRHADGKGIISPALSDDGGKLAYARRSAGNEQGEAALAIFVQVKDVSRKIGEVPETASKAEPGIAWSPDGKAVAISGKHVCIIDVETSSMRTFPDAEGTDNSIEDVRPPLDANIWCPLT